MHSKTAATQRQSVTAWRALTGAVLTIAIGCGAAMSPRAHADDDPTSHRVAYSVTAEQPTTASIYYREVQPPTWADYSHNPYEFSPKDDVRLEPGKPWVRDTTLSDPGQWAMVTVTTAGQTPQSGQTLHCLLTVDGIVVDHADGPNGALCSLRHW
jgi:hypothetical protein